MRNFGHLTLNTEQLRKLLGLPDSVEIVDVRTPDYKTGVQFRLTSKESVDGLTFPNYEACLIQEVTPHAHASYLAEHYEQIYLDFTAALYKNKIKEGPSNG